MWWFYSLPDQANLQVTTVRHCKVGQDARHACEGKGSDETASRQDAPPLVSSARPYRNNATGLPQPGQDPHATERRLETSPRGDPTLQITRGQSSRKMTDTERQWSIDPERLIQWDGKPWRCGGVQHTTGGVRQDRMTQNAEPPKVTSHKRNMAANSRPREGTRHSGHWF